MIKAIIFDIGGVVYIGKQKANEYMREKLNISKDQWEKFAIPIWEDLLIGKISEERGMVTMAQKLQIDKEKLVNLWKKAFKARFKLNRNLLKIIKSLKNSYLTAILSDQWSIPHNILITKEIGNCFDVLIFSHIVGSRKPNKLIYRTILKKLKLSPSECIFIDDQKINLEPARKLGMKAILFKNNSQLVDNLRSYKLKFKAQPS